MFYYFLDTELSKGWNDTRITSTNVENCTPTLADKFINIKGNIGHHFSFLCSPELISDKIKHYSHCEQFKHLASPAAIRSKMLELKDVLERPGFRDLHGDFTKLVGNEHLPTYMKENWEHYKKYTYDFFKDKGI